MQMRWIGAPRGAHRFRPGKRIYRMRSVAFSPKIIGWRELKIEDEFSVR